MSTMRPSSYAHSQLQMDAVSVLQQYHHYLADFGHSPVTHLKMCLALNMPNSLVKRVVQAGQAYQQLALMSEKTMQKLLRKKAWRKQMMRKIHAYLRRRQKYHQHYLDPALLKLPIDIDSELKHILHGLREMHAALTDCMSEMRIIAQESITLNQQMQRTEHAYHVALNQKAIDTGKHMLTALSDCGYEIREQDHGLLNPMSKIAEEFVSIDLDKLVLAQREKHGEAIHHGHIIRMVNLLAALSRYPACREELGIDIEQLKVITHEEIHKHINCLREHAVFAAAEKAWLKHDVECDELKQQHKQLIQTFQNKVEDLQCRQQRVEQQVEAYCQQVEAYQKQYSQLFTKMAGLRPSMSANKKKDDLLEAYQEIKRCGLNNSAL